MERLAGLPLALSLANVALRKRLELGQDVAAAVDYVIKSLERRGLSGLDRLAGAGSGETIAALLGSTLERLDPKARSRLAELAVFPESTDIPLAMVHLLWAKTADFAAAATEDLLIRLSDLSLAAPGLERETVRLHPLVREFMGSKQGDALAGVHGQLLDACWQRFGLASWADLPAESRVPLALPGVPSGRRRPFDRAGGPALSVRLAPSQVRGDRSHCAHRRSPMIARSR